jgi:putative membrane protein
MPIHSDSSRHAVEDETGRVPTPDSVPASDPALAPNDTLKPRPALGPMVRTRTGATWVGICVGAIVLVALVIFMMQNTAQVDVTFLGMHGSAPLALMLLIAGVGVGIIALVVGTLRIGQLKRRIRAVNRNAAAVQHPGV